MLTSASICTNESNAQKSDFAKSNELTKYDILQPGHSLRVCLPWSIELEQRGQAKRHTDPIHGPTNYK
ncbi:hypothetical protein E1297_39630 [Roseibium sp. RKSG952]|nr:hypothetical protein [Roseibium sp. RKSG952]